MTINEDSDKQIDKPSSVTRHRSWTGLVVFIIKTCVVAVVISACVIFVANWIISDLQDVATTTIADLRSALARNTIGGKAFWSKVETELDRAADPASDLRPEEKKKLIHDVRVIVARWRPFIDAAQDEMRTPSAN
jgi:hypothetical protein